MFLLCITDDDQFQKCVSKIILAPYDNFGFFALALPVHSQKAALSTPRAPLFLLLSFPKLRERFQRHKD